MLQSVMKVGTSEIHMASDNHVLSGGNFSAGEKQLLALCRAIVKDSRVIILVSSKLDSVVISLITTAG